MFVSARISGILFRSRPLLLSVPLGLPLRNLLLRHFLIFLLHAAYNRDDEENDEYDNLKNIVHGLACRFRLRIVRLRDSFSHAGIGLNIFKIVVVHNSKIA